MCACHFYVALDRYTTPLKIKFANYTTLSKKLDRSIYVKTSFISELTALSEKKLGVNIMSNSILFLLVIIESYTICMTSADIMSTRDSHLNQNKYVLPTTLCHYALKNGLKWLLKEIFCSSASSSIWVSSDILRSPQNQPKKFHLVLTFLRNVEKKWKVLSNVCDLLRISELYRYDMNVS